MGLDINRSVVNPFNQKFTGHVIYDWKNKEKVKERFSGSIYLHYLWYTVMWLHFIFCLACVLVPEYFISKEVENGIALGIIFGLIGGVVEVFHFFSLQQLMKVSNFNLISDRKAVMIKVTFALKALNAHIPVLFLLIEPLINDDTVAASTVSKVWVYSKIYQVLLGYTVVKLPAFLIVNYLWPFLRYGYHYLLYFNWVSEAAAYQSEKYTDYANSMGDKEKQSTGRLYSKLNKDPIFKEFVVHS
jgi:hypothetical protein